MRFKLFNLITFSFCLLGFLSFYSIFNPAKLFAGEWAMFRRDSVHSGFNLEEINLLPPLEVKWTFETGQGFSGAIVIGDKLYVESGLPAVLYSLNATSGAVNWSYQTQKISNASPAYANETVLTGSHCANCLFEAVDSKTGILKWSLPFPQGSRDPVIENGVAYFGSDDHRIRAVNISNGSLLWTSPLLNDGVTAVPAVANGKVYVGTWNSRLYSLNVLNGSISWFYSINPSNHVIFSSPTVVGGTVFFGAGNGAVYAVNALNGTLKWVFGPTSDSVWSSPAVANGIVYVQSLAGTVYALGANSGNLIWSYQTSAPPSSSQSSPAVANNVVYIGSSDGSLYAFHATTGNLLWSQDLGAPVTTSPVVANDMVYVGAGGKFYAFGKAADLIDVPYQAQDDPRWKDHKYDSLNATIGQVGCALSSATMVLAAYGIDKLPDGTPLTVDSLNTWLNNNSDGAWRVGMTSWTALSRLSKLLNDQNANYPILDYKKIKPPDFPLIDGILTNDKNPLIFEETKPLSPSGVHFVAARGMNEPAKDYSILDPLDQSRENFLIPPDLLVSARYLFPTHTNLSYLVLHADQGLNVEMKNSAGQSVGQLDEQLPLIHDDDPTHTTGNKFWELTLEDPASDTYKIKFSAAQSGWYEYELYAYNKDAEVEVFKQRIYVDAGNPTLFNLNYSQDGDDTAVLARQVTFATLRTDLLEMQRLGYIKNSGLVKSFLKLIDIMEQYYPKKISVVKKSLDLFEKYLKRNYPKYINLQAYQLLIEDVGLLRRHLLP